jgi:hypothetical protein
MDLAEGCFPKSMRFIASKMENFNRNRFRLQTQGSDTARPYSIVTLNLPENALLHMPSLRMYMDVATTSVGTGTDIVYGKVGNYANSLLAKVEVYCNGIMLQNGCAEYNSVYRLLKIGRSTPEVDASLDRCVNNSYISNTDAVEAKTFCCHDWMGVLNETSAEYLPTELLGSIQIRLTFADASVLVPKQVNVDIGQSLTSAQAVANALQISYSVSNIYFTIDSVVPDVCYNQLLRQQLQEKGEMAINYKEYYTFSLDSITSTSFTNRFSLSSGSIDKIYTTIRDSDYQNVGIIGTALVNALGSAYVANRFLFRSYDSVDAGAGGSGRYYNQINNVQYPQYTKTSLECLADTFYANDKIVKHGSQVFGNLITSQESFNKGLFMNTLLLNCPTELGVGLKSGYNSKGVNTQMTAVVNGIVIPANNQTGGGGNAANINSGNLSCFVVVEVTQSIIAGLGKQIAVSY